MGTAFREKRIVNAKWDSEFVWHADRAGFVAERPEDVKSVWGRRDTNWNEFRDTRRRFWIEEGPAVLRSSLGVCRILALGLVFAMSSVSPGQEREVDASGQARWRYTFDLPVEIQMARSHAQAKPGKAAEFNSYTQKIDELEILVTQLQSLEQNQAPAAEISVQEGLVNQKVQEVVFLVPHVEAPEASKITDLARRMFGF